MESIMELNPTVCVVKNEYQIIIITKKDALIKIKVGDEIFYNHSNGIRISSKGVHKFFIPQHLLDKEKCYTVFAKEMVERLAYHSKTKEEVKKDFKFKPITKTKNINIYHLADVHGKKDMAIGCAKKADKEIDLLVLNGDISSTSNTFDDIILSYKIASEITNGEIPCVISRGNHDLRGPGAERLADYMPTDNGKSYYTFKTGCIWGILIDAGEDKNDDHPEYADTMCCHIFRKEQEKEIKKVIENAKSEYEKDDVKYKLIISHIPFTFKYKEVHNIEKELYTSIAKLLRENIKPNLMLCGHTHIKCISTPKSEYDYLGHPCTVVVGSDERCDTDKARILSGALITLNNQNFDVSFNTQNKIYETQTLSY
ncbi:MAG: metallophosphoesterase [Ruminococcaceae bacterium]|nr:metallophosphoesterase [Oscillospiraceae bacterium]